MNRYALAGNIAAAHPAADWRPRHDPRSRSYAAADLAPVAEPGVGAPLLVTAPHLRQGPEGACAGFGSAHAANTHRLEAARDELLAGLSVSTPRLLTADDARALYNRAQQLDNVRGDESTGVIGTSVLAAMLAGREAGLWSEFRWCFGTADIARTVDQLRRPVVIGIPWTDGMYATDAEGRVKVEGQLVGGHCLEVFRFERSHPLLGGRPGFEWLNSHANYGPGDSGVGVVSARDLSWLLANRGEAAVPLPGGSA